MKKIRLIELVREDFEKKLFIFGMKSFFSNVGRGFDDKLFVDYYCFNPSSDLLNCYNGGTKPSSNDLFHSSIKVDFLESAFDYLNEHYGLFDSYEEFKEQDNFLIMKYGVLDKNGFVEELNKYPFGDFWLFYQEAHRKFIFIKNNELSKAIKILNQIHLEKI